MNFLINLMDYSIPTRIGIAEDTKNPEILAFLSDDPSEDVKEAVAKNKITSKKVVNKLSFDKSRKVQTATASNLKLSKDNLDRLAKEGDTDTKKAVINNPNTETKTREFLSEDKSWEVLVELARSLYTDVIILKKLSLSEDTLVSRDAKENPKFK